MTMRFGISSILVFLFGLSCYVALLIFSPVPGGNTGRLLVFLLILSVPVGLTLAFVAALKTERPARYTIIGFTLNSVWLLFLLVPLAQSLVTSSPGARSKRAMEETMRTQLAATYGRYVFEEHPSRGSLFYQLTLALAKPLRTLPVSKKDLVKYLGEPDTVTVSDAGEWFHYEFMSPMHSRKARPTLPIWMNRLIRFCRASERQTKWSDNR